MDTLRKLGAVCAITLATTACTLPRQSRSARAPVERGGTARAVSAQELPTRPPIVPTSELVGARVVDADGAISGTVTDVLIDEASGAIVGVAATLDLAPPDGKTEHLLLDYRGVEWPAGIDAPRVVLGCKLEAFGTSQYGELFESDALATVRGRVTETRREPAWPRDATVVKLRDDENLVHRVLLEATSLVERSFKPFAVGEAVEIEGALTRDETGKLLIASRIARGEDELALRNDAGIVAWRQLARASVGSYEVLGSTLHMSDEATTLLDELWLDWESGVVRSVGVQLEGNHHALPWTELRRGEPDAGWTTKLDAVALSKLPPVPRASDAADEPDDADGSGTDADADADADLEPR